MTLAYIAKLGLEMQKTNVSTQKIGSSQIKTYRIVIIIFQVFH